MVMTDDRPDRLERAEVPAEVIADDRVRLDDLELLGL